MIDPMLSATETLKRKDKVRRLLNRLENLIEKRFRYKSFNQLQADRKQELVDCVNEQINEVKDEIREILEEKNDIKTFNYKKF